METKPKKPDPTIALYLLREEANKNNNNNNNNKINNDNNDNKQCRNDLAFVWSY